MRELTRIILENEERLMASLLEYAKTRGYVKYTSTLFEAWRLSISGLSKAMTDAILGQGQIPELHPDEDYTDDPCAQFGILEAQRHRERGVSLSMFLGLLKYYRQCYLDLVEAEAPEASRSEYARTVNRFFDRLEIGLCTEWAADDKDEQVEELRETNRFLTNEKNKYLTLVEGLRNSVILLDSECRIDTMNLAAGRLLQESAHPGHHYYCPKRDRSFDFRQEELGDVFRPDCVQGRRVEEFMPWIAEEIETFARSDETEATFRKALDTPRGKRHFEVDLGRMPDMSGKYAGILVSLDDVTESTRANEALRLSEKRLKAGLEMSEMKDATFEDIVSFSLEKAIELTDSSMGYVAFLDETESVMTMHSWSKQALQECVIASPQDVFMVEETGLWGEAVRQRKPVVTNDYSAPNPLKKGLPEGHPKLIRHMNVPVFDGERIVAVTGVGNKEDDYDATDVLQLKLLMQGLWRHVQRRETEAELRHTFEKLSTIIDSFPGFIHIIDRDFNMVMAGGERIGPRRMPREAALGRKCYKVLKGLDDMCPGCGLTRVFDSGASHERQTSENEAELFGKHYKVYTTPITDEEGRVVEAVEIFLDVTDMKAMEKRLLTARDEAEAANRSKSEFLANMSHEIRTPLNGAMGMLQLLETTDLTDEQAEYVRTGLNSGNSLLRVISDILDLSRIEAGKVEIRREEFNLARTLDVVLETFREEVRRKGISLYYEFSLAAAADYVGDETRLRQVLFNLVGNAVKFTKDGDIKIEVWPLENDGGEHLLFSVSDTGVGVPKDKLKNVFEPFSQADGSYTRKYQGSGLGLTIVNRLVSLMGGNVSMESEPGLGTTVHFTIAVSRAEKDAKPAREPVESIDLTGLRVVVAEDNDVNRMAAVRMLQTAGCEVIEAVDGSEVLAILAKEKADLVLMDVQMPKMDGVIATRNIRSGAGGMYDPNIPIVAMTAHAMAGDREKFLEAGMNDYIAKPVNMRDLTETISKYMDG